MVTFGHAAFYGTGAYTLAFLLLRTNCNFVVALLASIFINLWLGFIIGSLSVRLVRFYFAMLTLAFGMLIWTLIFRWYSVTGGGDGLVGITLPSALQPVRSTYWLIAIITYASMGLLWILTNSSFGLSLRAIRENAEKARFNGINVVRYRLAAFVVSAGLAGLAGALFVCLSHSAFPEYAYWTKSGDGVLVSVLGGMFHFFGPLVGAGVYVILQHIIMQFTTSWALFTGCILVMIALFLPEGILGARKSLHRAERPVRGTEATIIYSD
jgi:branched-chain amino acid transport system permease protein